MTARKYILIPEFRPLYAMRKCYGPTHGPLSEPTPTPVDVIGELLLQKGNEALTIYEVKVDAKAKTSSEPVRLTLENYTKPYDEIAGAPVNPEPAVTPVEEPTPVVPTVVTPEPTAQEKVAPAPDQDETAEETPEVKPVEEVEETEDQATDEPAEEPVTEVPAETDEGETEQTAAPVGETPVEETEEKPAEETEETSGDPEPEETEELEKQETAEEADPFAGMTKAERKAARRAAHQQA